MSSNDQIQFFDLFSHFHVNVITSMTSCDNDVYALIFQSLGFILNRCDFIQDVYVFNALCAEHFTVLGDITNDSNFNTFDGDYIENA